jgi:hypothetical protein
MFCGRGVYNPWRVRQQLHLQFSLIWRVKSDAGQARTKGFDVRGLVGNGIVMSGAVRGSRGRGGGAGAGTRKGRGVLKVKLGDELELPNVVKYKKGSLVVCNLCKGNNKDRSET